MIKHLQELIAIPSVTAAPSEEGMPFGREVHRALLYVLDLCENLGFRTKNLDNYLGYAEIGQGDEMMGILCHLDVVPVGNDWDYPPFGGEIHQGKIYGRGVMDDKGPAMAVIYAMKDILDSGVQLGKRVRIIFGCQEEDGDWADMEYYKAHEEIPQYGFTPDADFPAIHGEKGIAMVNISMSAQHAGFEEITGGMAANMVPDNAKAVIIDQKGNRVQLEKKGKSAHGSMPEDGENAISKLMEEIHALNPNSSKFAAFYMDKIGFDLHGQHINLGISDEASGQLTLNAGTIKKENGTVILSLDIRYPVTFTLDEIVTRIKTSVESYDVDVSVDYSMKPVYMDKNGPVIKKLMEAYREVTGDETEALVIGGGTYARAMDHIVAFGPVFPGRELTEHQKNENIYVDDLEKARKIYKIAINKLL